ncbi:hypothetical protein IP84_09865 [beta proteobacterium AAP99]|nr:hypothetical protein IP84_09865 [beta proteobacterium AAP99]
MIATTLTLCGLTANAQTGDPVAGAAKYQTVYANQAWPLQPKSGSCVGCHGSAQAPSIGFNGRESPAGIAFAIANNRGGKGFLDGILSAQDIADISAYITNPNISVAPVIRITPSSLALSGTVAAPADGSLGVVNTGARALFINAISVSGTGFALNAAGTTCRLNEPIAVNAQCQLAVRFTSSQAVSNAQGFLVINHNAPGNVSTITLTATIGSGAGITVAGGPLSFPDTPVGTSSPEQLLTLRSTGSAALRINSIVFSPGDYLAGPGTTCTPGTDVPAGGSCTLGVMLRPVTQGPRPGSVSITHNASSSPTTVELSGAGTPSSSPVARWSASALDFPATPVGSTTAAQSISISNTGGAALVISAFSVSGSGFQLTDETCTRAALAPGGSCSVNLRFAPAAAGASSGTLAVSSNSSPPAAPVALSGIGVPEGTAILITTPAELSFASTQVGQSAPALTLTVTNTGAAAATLSAPRVSGPHAEDFSVTPDAACSAGSILPPTGRCVFSVVFTPRAAGTRTASLSIGGAGAAAISLMGTATPAPASLTVDVGARLDLGTVIAGSRVTRSVRLSAGAADLLVGSVVINGPFSIEPTGSCGRSGFSIAAGQSCTVDLSFSALSEGANTGSLVITSTAPGSPTTVQLSANVQRSNAARTGGGCSLAGRHAPVDPLLPLLLLLSMVLSLARARQHSNR